MSSSHSPALLENVLRSVPRPYRIPPIPAATAVEPATNPAAALAVAIEHARAAVAREEAPDPAFKRLFLEALARMIDNAMRTDRGDPAFQAMVLRHEAPLVREHASLCAHAERDRRAVRAIVDAIAHPGKAQGRMPGPHRQALARLHAQASAAAWTTLAAQARQLLLEPETPDDPRLQRGVQSLLDNPALGRLLRLAELAPDEQVRRHQALLDRNGPRSGSPEATALGWATQRRGAAVEASTACALDTLAQRLNERERNAGAYRVVTSMRVPGSIPGKAERAKTEWDAVLLRQAPSVSSPPAASPLWDVCLLVEAKASIDAAATDFPRLLRGVRLLSHAGENTIHEFATRQGPVRLRGASLSALRADADDLAGMVLYCCDVPADTAPRLLSAASRMQLLSAQASLDYASGLAARRAAGHQALEPVWQELLASPRWRGVLHQYATLRRARALMVNPADLTAAIDSADRAPDGTSG